MIGILVPMPEEIALILSEMKVLRKTTIGKRDFYSGELAGKECVVALSRIGKVASAVTAAMMIQTFGVDKIILTGAAGAIDKKLKIGDLVIGSNTIQHDMDCSPLFPRFEAPLLGISKFPCDVEMVNKAQVVFKDMVFDGKFNFLNDAEIKQFSLNDVKVFIGTIASGDQFIKSSEQSLMIETLIPNTLCVEMEAGAVGQVCFEYDVPFVVIRTISDLANHNANVDFVQFVEKVVSSITLQMVLKLVSSL